MLGTTRSTLICGLVAAAVLGCGNDLILAAYDLDVGPTPATPGETVFASFQLDLLPTQRHTMTLVIDGLEHLSVTSEARVDERIQLEVGDAGDLIDTYGEGDHVMHVEVHVPAEGETTRSQSAVFQLQAGTS